MNLFWQLNNISKKINKTVIYQIKYYFKLKILTIIFLNLFHNKIYKYNYYNVPSFVANKFIKNENKEDYYSKYIRYNYKEIKYK